MAAGSGSPRAGAGFLSPEVRTMRGPKPNGTLVLLTALILPLPGPSGPKESPAQESRKAELLGFYRSRGGASHIEALGGDSMEVTPGPLIFRDTDTFSREFLLRKPGTSPEHRPYPWGPIIERGGSWELENGMLTLHYEDGTVDTGTVSNDSVTVVSYNRPWVYTLLTPHVPGDSIVQRNLNTLSRQSFGGYWLESIDGSDAPILLPPLGGDSLLVDRRTFLHLRNTLFRRDLFLRSVIPTNSRADRTRIREGAWEVEDDEITFYFEDGTVEKGTFLSDFCILVRSHGADWLFKKIGSAEWRPPDCPEPDR